MPELECTTWKNLLQSLPDPCHRRGCRYPWWILLCVISAALVSGQKHPMAIILWTQEHAHILHEQVWLKMPSGSTLRRALQMVDVQELEARLRAWTQAHMPTSGSSLQAHALDGKTLRGAGRQGTSVHVGEEVVHGSGIVLWQQAVETKSNEIPLGQRMLAERDLQGVVITADAMHTQVETARVILQQGGHELLVVKKNQPMLYQALQEWFAEPAWPEELVTIHRTCTHQHGRHEHRTLERSSMTHLPGLWPGACQAMRRVTECWTLQGTAMRSQVSYALTSVPPELASAADLERLWRGHWTVENQVHHVRDVTWERDACQVAIGHASHALAALRNGLTNLFRLQGRTCIASALRYFGAFAHRALRLLGF